MEYICNIIKFNKTFSNTFLYFVPMRTAVEVSYYKLKIPMKSPFTTSFGTVSHKVVYVFEMKSNGIVAYSECITSEEPYYGPEDNITAFHMIRDFLLPMIRDLPSPQEFLNRARSVKGNNMAKAALELLLYDYHSKASGIALHRYLDRNSRGEAYAGISLGMDRIEVTLKRIQESLDRGYRRIKVKIKRGEEMNILRKVRDQFPDISLSADANSDYTVHDFDLLKGIDRFDLVYLEQPLYHDDIVFHAKLAKLISTPLCLDESIVSPELAVNAFDLGSCSVINIKPGRVGGLYNSIEIAKIARKYNGHVWIGGMLETGIGRSFNIAMASSSLIDYPGDTSPNDRYFEQDITDRVFRMDSGIIKPFDLPGIGVNLDVPSVNKFTLESGVLR